MVTGYVKDVKRRVKTMNNKEKVVRVLTQETTLVTADEISKKSKVSEQGVMDVCKMLSMWGVVQIYVQIYHGGKSYILTDTGRELYS